MTDDDENNDINTDDDDGGEDENCCTLYPPQDPTQFLLAMQPLQCHRQTCSNNEVNPLPTTRPHTIPPCHAATAVPQTNM